MFANLFKPKWRHSSPDVRVRAVNRLRSDRPAHSDILRSLLLDDHSCEVRRAVIERISDLSLLIQALVSEQDQELRRYAASAVADQLSALSMNEQLSWAEQIPDNQSRVELALVDISSTLRSHLIDLIDEQRFLISIATKAATAQTRREAALRITDPEQLEILSRESKGSDKAVHRIAREALQTLRDQKREEARLQARRQELLEALNSLVNGQDHQLFQARFDVIHREWEQLSHDDAAQVTRYNTLKTQAERFIADEAARKAQAEAEENARIERERQDLALTETLEALCLRSAETAELLPELQAAISEVNSFRETAPVSRALEDKAVLAEKLCQSLLRLDEVEASLREQLESPLEDSDKALVGFLSSIDWPQGLQSPALLNQAQQLLNESRQNQQQLKQQHLELVARLDARLTDLEAAIERGEIRTALKQSERAEQKMRTLGAKLPEKLDQRHRALVARLQEMKDWQGFAVNGKKEQLCEQMEALVDSTLPPQPLADQIRALQKEWKELDSGSAVHSQKLWQRFRSAAEAAYAPCEAHFGAQKEKRQQNLAQREEICHQLETLIGSINWDEADWPGLERICHTAKREWKQFSPVDRAPGKVVQQRFNQIIRDLDARLRDWHQQCATSKQSLIDAAAALTEWDDVSAAAQEAKALQRQWKETGPAFRSTERALWQSFREHCDTIFDRLKSGGMPTDPIKVDQAPALLKEEDLSRLTSCADLLSKAEKAILDGDLGMLDTLLGAIRESLSQVPDQWQSALNRRIDAIEPLITAPQGLEEQLSDSEHQLRELCIRLEILLGQPSPDEDQAQRMEYQMLRLQQALDEQSRNPSTADVLELELEWRTIPFSSVFPQLQQRFNQLKQRTE
ncbi:DUF349 domain-containing protein [Marinobacterium sp. YM272]|uniref:DUF349 domain-containing protein n=1 Tax=Marinobacterium sp. YM272 TaxID=3421654 RepID=UPI003D7F9DD9